MEHWPWHVYASICGWKENVSVIGDTMFEWVCFGLFHFVARVVYGARIIVTRPSTSFKEAPWYSNQLFRGEERTKALRVAWQKLWIQYRLSHLFIFLFFSVSLLVTIYKHIWDSIFCFYFWGVIFCTHSGESLLRLKFKFFSLILAQNICLF